MSEEQSYKPFERKPEHLKADYLRRKEKWDESLETVDDDISHRRFNCTLQVSQLVGAFKKCVHKNEVTKKNLITCYRVVLQKILQDPTLTDEEFMSMYSQIQSRANEVYERRSRELKRIRG